MNTAPVALFTYCRLLHTRQTVEALQCNALAPRTDLVVFSDGPKHRGAAERVSAVRSYLATLSGFRSVRVVERDYNFGLARSIIAGVTEMLADQERIIVLEDDMVTSKHFLQFMNDGLSLYEHNERVASIHGYMYPVRATLPETFFLQGADCWGWSTWRRAWSLFVDDSAALLREISERGLESEFDPDNSRQLMKMLGQQARGEIDSWAIRWHASVFLNRMYTLYPGRSLVRNIGNDGSGIHCGAVSDFDVATSDEPINAQPRPVLPDENAKQAVRWFFRRRRMKSLPAALFNRTVGLLRSSWTQGSPSSGKAQSS
jgi:hypothetical protein